MRTERIVVVCGIVVVALCALVWGEAQTETRQAPVGTRLKDVAVAMRDGVVLRADVWLPTAEGRFPTLVYRTPYGKQFAAKEWTTFDKAVAHGYAVVIQDVRGRYASDGEFVPYQNEGKDGYDTIEWAAQQSWSDWNVRTFGLSYPGAVQWLAAVETPPHLKAMVPAMTFSTPRNFFYSGGLFDGSWLEWTWMNIAPDARKRKNLPGPKTYEEARASYRDETVQPKLVEPGKIYKLELNRLLTSNAFLKGHRIRVQISGAFYPHFSRNLQTGKSEIYSAEMQAGHLRIQHDAKHQSRLILPVVKKEKEGVNAE